MECKCEVLHVVTGREEDRSLPPTFCTSTLLDASVIGVNN